MLSMAPMQKLEHQSQIVHTLELSNSLLNDVIRQVTNLHPAPAKDRFAENLLGVIP